MRDCCAELSGIEADSETMLTALYRAALKAAPASPLPEGGDEALIAELKEARGLLKEALDDFISDEMEQAIRAFLARNGKGEG